MKLEMGQNFSVIIPAYLRLMNILLTTSHRDDEVLG